MGVYLEEHPPARQQYRAKRRAGVTGAIVVHTAENNPDITGPDSSAESVARFISKRTDAAASYHSIVDSDTICRVGRYEWEMFHEGTGGNRWSLGLSFACRAAAWPSLPERWFTGAIANGAQEAANMADWIRATTGIEVPARRITAAEYRAGKPGFISHAELDPTRRSDPGAGFPWAEFLELFAAKTGAPPMAETEPTSTERGLIRIYQGWLLDNGANLGPSKADGEFGRFTLEASQVIIDRGNQIEAANRLINARVGELEAYIERLEQDLVEAREQATKPDVAAMRVLLDVIDRAADEARSAMGWDS